MRGAGGGRRGGADAGWRADDAEALVAAIHDKGMRAAVALKPDTAVEAVFPVLPLLDMVLVMTVEPGFGGQKFMEEQMSKVRELRARRPELDIQVDGGLNAETVDVAARAGANVIVAGSAVFKADDSAAMISTLRNAVERAQGEASA